MSAATIWKVAELAGVSIATVSRSLTHPDKVSQSTRERVLEAVRSTGYLPNRQAADFRRSATQNIVLLVRDIANPFYLEIYRGVEEFAFENGYRVLLGDAGNDDRRVLRYVDMVRARQADGLILMTGWLPSDLQASDLPKTVVALEQLIGVDMPAVLVDNRAGARTGVKHLLDLGHRHIAHVAGPDRLVMSTDRHLGYRDALISHGLTPNDALTYHGDFHFTSGSAAVRAFASSGQSFTAIFCSNDEMAVGAINELRTIGLSVPGEVSVVGFDDVEYALSSDPPLTTLRQPRRQIGRLAMRMLIDLLLGSQVEQPQEQLELELVVRASTAPPPLPRS